MLHVAVVVALLVTGDAASVLESGHHDRSPQYRPVCTRQATCQEHSNLTCFGSSLPYTTTTVELVEDAANQSEVEERLSQLEAGLRKVPRCWQLVQPLLCSLYRPPCKNNSVHLISNTLCEGARKACNIIMPQVGPQVGTVEWPYFLRCEQDIFFTKGCKNDVAKSDIPKIRFNLSQECPTPLIYTTNRHSWYSAIDYCGISCTENPLVSKDDQAISRWYDACFVTFSIVCCLLTLLLYLPYCRSNNTLTYPARLKLWFTACVLIVCVGHSAQFLGGREQMLCNVDGTIRRNEPSPNWSLACVANFVACYYFLNAAYIWFVFICCALNKSILVVPQRSRSEADYWKSMFSYFHLAAWCVPLILCVIVAIGPGIEADSIRGVCFVSRYSILYRELLVSLPFFCALLIGAWFLVHLTYRLHQRKYSSSSILKEDSHRNIDKAIRRLRIFFLVMLAIGLITGFCLWYEASRYELWQTSIREHFACQLNVVQPASDELNHVMEPNNSCELKDKPNLVILQVQLLVLPLTCLILLAITFKSSVAEAFKHAFLKNILRKETEPEETGFTQKIAVLFEREEDDDEEDHEPGDSVSQHLSSSYANVFSGLGYNVLPHQPVMIGRRYSSTSDVSHQTSNYMSSRAMKRKTRKERNRHRVAEKIGASKGDNGEATVPFLANQDQSAAPQETQVRKRVLTQEDIVNSPFTHGMSGEARDNNLYPYWRKPRRPGKLPSASEVPKPPLRPPIQPPMYSALTGGLPPPGPHGMQMPFAFPPQPCPLIDMYTGFPIPACPHYFTPYGIMSAPAPLNNDFIPFHDLDNIKSPIIPLRAHETGSETSYRAIVPSDTEYDTDAHRPQTAIPRNNPTRGKAGGRSSAPFKVATGGFVSN